MKRIKIIFTLIVTLAVIFITSNTAFAQKVGFIASDVIREQFTEAQQADQRIRTIVEEWKRELSDLELQIQDIEQDIQRNRLVWSDDEKTKKDADLEVLKKHKLEYARKKFESGGEYDVTVKTIMKPIEEKIYAAIQNVATDEGYDIIWDKSVNPLPYTNFKYDLTVKVLRKLGVDVKKLEDELQQKISKDPRNQEKETKSAPRGRSRQRSKDGKEIEKEEGTTNKEGLTPNSERSIEKPTEEKLKEKK
ncbi:MAG TPA: OmpH family outer membrane protein [Candidatus Kapabacteria bacterium]|nr:OmpH family outer membrane protein [Candidatus Kapabacteria bacterium]